MRTKRFRLLLAALLPLAMAAQVEVSYEAGLSANAGNNELAPHYIMANHPGTRTRVGFYRPSIDSEQNITPENRVRNTNEQ